MNRRSIQIVAALSLSTLTSLAQPVGRQPTNADLTQAIQKALPEGATEVAQPLPIELGPPRPRPGCPLPPQSGRYSLPRPRPHPRAQCPSRRPAPHRGRQRRKLRGDHHRHPRSRHRRRSTRSRHPLLRPPVRSDHIQRLRPRVPLRVRRLPHRRGLHPPARWRPHRRCRPPAARAEPVTTL